jgi:hypothetical protein
VRRERIATALSNLPASRPSLLLGAGVAFSLVMIQLVMRNCFDLNNLLLREQLPADSPLTPWLLQTSETRIALYFMALFAACAVPAAALLAVHGQPMPRAALFLRNLLIALLGIQVLLLPVNYGYLVLDTSLPRVASIESGKPLAEGTDAWLVWEGKEGMTFLVRARKSPQSVRKSLLTMPRSEAQRIEVVAFDPIYRALFAQPAGNRNEP